MLRLRVTGRGSERTFLDLLNAQHIVQGVTHERGGIFHQAQRFQVTTIQAVAVLQDLDADGQRVQRAAQLVEDVLQEFPAGLVDTSEVFPPTARDERSPAGPSGYPTYIHSLPSPEPPAYQYRCCLYPKDLFIVTINIFVFFMNSIIIHYLRVCCALCAFVSFQVQGGRQLRHRHRCRPSLPLRQSLL